MDLGRQSYFELFSLPESFDLDREALDRAHRLLQGRYHPDRYVNADERERRLALQLTSLINDAYQTLCSPLRRAAYLLSLHGVNPEEVDQAQLGGDFLHRQLALREELEDIRAGGALEALDAFKKGVQTELDEGFAQFRRYFLDARYCEARPVYNRLQFLARLREEVDQAEEKLLDY